MACNDRHRTRSPEQIFDKLKYYKSIFARICETVFKYHLSITKPAGGPDLVDAGAVHEAFHEVPLLLGLKGDKVHATLPAQRNHVFISEVFYCHGSS